MADHVMKNIIIIGDSRGGMIKEIANGIMQFSRQHEPYSVTLMGLFEPAYERVCSGEAQGLIGFLFEPEDVELCLQSNLKVVNISEHHHGQLLPSVLSNNEMIGELAAEYYVSHAYREFLFYGQDTEFSTLRERGFRNGLSKHGKTYHSVIADWTDHDFDQIESRVREANHTLAIFASSDNHANRVIRKLSDRGLFPQNDYAILGVNNESHYEGYYFTEISSVDPNFERIGYEAARCLYQQFSGQPYEMFTRINPLGVVTKLTTKYVIQDALLLEAIEYLNQHACQGVTTQDLVEYLNCSRRSIETRFREQMNISITKYILQLQMEEAAKRLKMTTDPVGWVARSVGFQDQRYFAKVFKDYFEMTPTEYRKKML